MVTLVRPNTSAEMEGARVAGFSSIADIGNRINGKVVTAGQFLAYERVMIGVVTSFLLHGEKGAYVNRIEFDKTFLKTSRRLEQKHGLDRVLMKAIPSTSDALCLLDLQDLTRLALRESIWVEFISGQRSVHFGYDLYVYFAGGRFSSQMRRAFVSQGFQVESLRALPVGYQRNAENTKAA